MRLLVALLGFAVDGTLVDAGVDALVQFSLLSDQRKIQHVRTLSPLPYETTIIAKALFAEDSESRYFLWERVAIGVESLRATGSAAPAGGQILDASSSCSEFTGLGYLGADLVIDEELGPLVMEVNARPGLQVQNVSSVGLVERLNEIDGDR
jgi:hypothetical protein